MSFNAKDFIQWRWRMFKNYDLFRMTSRMQLAVIHLRIRYVKLRLRQLENIILMLDYRAYHLDPSKKKSHPLD